MLKIALNFTLMIIKVRLGIVKGKNERAKARPRQFQGRSFVIYLGEIQAKSMLQEDIFSFL